MSSGAGGLGGAGNVVDWLFDHTDPQSIALRDSDHEVSFGALRERVREIAAFVRERTRSDEKPIVLLVGESTVEWVSGYLGVLYAGAIAAPLPPFSSTAMDQILAETSASLVLTTDPAHATERPTWVAIRDIPAGSRLDAPVAMDPDALALLLYTSGSTGRPRGVMLSTRNIVANTSAILGFCPLTREDRALVVLPFYYCYGASVLHCHLRAGASVAFPRTGFDVDILDALAQFDVTGLPAVSTLLRSLTARGALRAQRPPALRYVMASGGALSSRTVDDLVESVPGVTVYIRYGVTELTAGASYLPPDQLDARRGSIGRGFPGAPLRVVRPDGSAVRADSVEVGEIIVAGPSVARGYFGDHEETARCFRDGAYHTGDLARQDPDGFVYIVGREKELVKTAGHRVAPQEIEDVLLEATGVVEAGVCGVPHPTRGEALIAVLVLDATSPATIDALRAHCARRLPPHKVPIAIHTADALPRTASGKLSRRELAKWHSVPSKKPFR
ncbi:class I adenylate-forming enzyme family protein [soil metagenome]